MNMRKMITGAGAVAIIFMVTSTQAFSQQGPYGGAALRQPGMGQQQAMMLSQLTPEQQRAATNIYQDYQKATTQTMKRLWAQELQLMAALAADKIDETRVNSLVGSINTLRSNLYQERVKMYLQLAKADLMYPVMRSRGMMGRGMGLGRGMMWTCPMMGQGMPEPGMDTGPWE